MRPMTLKVVQWATGGVGTAAIRGVLEHPDLELVGCWVHSEAKNGKDVGELIGAGPIGVTATSSLEEILALPADAVIYAPLIANADEVAALLRSGKNVVTPGGWLYPSEKQAAPMRAAALEGNATLHGTGIAPGGISEKFPLLLSAMSTAVTFVRAEEFSDLRSYDAPDVLRYVMGFGDTPDKALTGPMQKMLDGGFIQAVKMVVDAAGFNADPRIRARQEVAVATAAIPSPIGVIEPGQVAARRFHWEATVDGEPVVRVTVNWLMGEENLNPAWTFGPAGQRYEMEIKGSPDFTVTVKGFQGEITEDGPAVETGIVATAAHCVNSVPAVCSAPPGIATYLDLPLISAKAHPRLSI
jgi:2,4-diaminopentanoate dehydrogenase